MNCQPEANMSNNAKVWIRVVVIAGIVAWPTVESYRLWDTTQKMQVALALEHSVAVKLEVTRAKQAQVARAGSDTTTTTGK